MTEDLPAKHAVQMSEDWLRGRPQLLAQLPELRSRRLACYCKLDAPCQADVLCRLANG